jgi:hypothetical protein
VGGAFYGGNTADYLSDGDGINATAGTGVAGYFTGDIDVTGTLYANGKDFKIDHPLDPANKYLFHASVESSEMMNIYTGNITTMSALSKGVARAATLFLGCIVSLDALSFRELAATFG